MVLLYDWKRWRIVANADNSHHKQKKWFSKYPILYPTWSVKFFNYWLFYLFIYLLIYLFIRVSKYSAVSSKIKKSVNDWRKLFKFIPLASIFTSYLSKGQFRLLSLKNSELRHLATFLHKVTRSWLVYESILGN